VKAICVLLMLGDRKSNGPVVAAEEIAAAEQIKSKTAKILNTSDLTICGLSFLFQKLFSRLRELHGKVDG
jgi:hypothetical protein